LLDSGDERTVRRDWRRRPTAAPIVKSFTIGAMVAARVHKSPRRKTDSGFTLIELMAVVVVIAVLAAIALPAYTEYIRRSRRAEAITLVNQLAQAQERWRANVSDYSTDLTTGGLNVANPSSGYYAASAATPARSETNAAIASCPSASAPTSRDSYSAIAIAQGAQASDTTCAVLKLNWVCGELRQFAGTSITTLQDATSNAAARKCWNR
jgi:type IV pilus assembly protein PilE